MNGRASRGPSHQDLGPSRGASSAHHKIRVRSYPRRVASTSPLQVLVVVPARGGSKGIPRKNLQLLAGRPLVAHAVATGLAAKLVDRVLCTTDDPEIADAARAAGAEVPFLRPPDLAADTSEDRPVFIHLLHYLDTPDGYRPDVIR